MRYIALLFLGFLVGVNCQDPKPAPKGKQPDVKGVPSFMGKSPVAYGPKPGGCSAFEIIVGRGTSEIGSFGLIVGDPLVSAVKRQVPGARGYAVQYPADMTANSVPTGKGDVIQRLTAQDKACPTQKFALVGYSQGAGVVRAAAPIIPASVQHKVLAVVLFGDPGMKASFKGWGESGGLLPPILQARLFENCAKGDPVCGAGDSFNQHLTYNSAGTTYQRDSANFIVAAFKGSPLPPKPTAGDGGPKGEVSTAPKPGPVFLKPVSLPEEWE